MITRRKIIYRHILWPNFYYGRSFFALLHERKASTQNYKFQIKYFFENLWYVVMIHCPMYNHARLS